jgi:hypothetical protein
MAGGQDDFIEHRWISRMEQDAAAAGVADDRVLAFAELVDRLVHQHLLPAFVLHHAHETPAALAGIDILRGRAGLEPFVARPLALLHAGHRPEKIFHAAAIRIS